MTCLLCDRTDSYVVADDGHIHLELCPLHMQTVFWAILRIETVGGRSARPGGGTE